MGAETSAESSSGNSDADPVGELLAVCLECVESEQERAVEAACRAHPEHSLELRLRLAALQNVGLLAPRPAEFPERLGEFRLLERLGGGGMGVVYRALQEPLGRVVALKLIRPESLYFPKARERFRRETEAVARLQHPGIVPIYTVGEEQGIPYFAMELVVGATLAEVIADLQGRAPESLSGRDLDAVLRARAELAPEAESAGFEGSWVHQTVEIAIHVAEALAHAHSRGVLHRDVKPSNIVLTPDGRARLFDFGLATMSDEAARVTATGATIGTLLYMAPEQVRGDAAMIDERSDVYALGVTLYEALTLQVPYLDTNTNTTRLAIAQGRPDSIRARNRSVPKDLETVCFKAMERERGQRYADAASFARDLRNVLERRPIEARPPGAGLRLLRWVQRKPALATAIVFAFAILVGAPLGLYLVSRGHARELEAALEKARTARTAAERSEEQAREQSRLAGLSARDSEAVSDFLVELFGAADPAVSRGEDLRAKQLLDDGAARLDIELGEQPEVRRRLRLRMGSSYSGLGEHAKAKALFEQALEDGILLHGEDSLECGEAHYRLAWTLRALGSPDARREMERSLAIRRMHPAESSDDELRTLVGMAAVATAEKRTEEALAFYEEALALFPKATGDPRELRQIVFSNRAHTLYAAKRFELAAADAREAIDLQRELFGVNYPGTLASLNTLALSLKNLDRAGEAEPVFEELLRVGEVVYGRESTNVAIFASNHAGLLDDLGRRAEAAQAYEEAWKRFCVKTAPTFPQRLTCGMNLALIQMRLGRWRRAEELYAELAPALLEAEGATSARRATALNNLALCLESRGDFGRAVEELQRALEFTRAQSDSGVASRAARIGGNQARLLLRARQLEEAQAELDALAQYVQRNPSRGGIAAAWKFDRALLAEASGEQAVAQSLFAEVAATEKLDEDVRWLAPAASTRLAGLRADPELALRAAGELESLLGQTHVETLDALETVARLAEAAADQARAAELRAEILRRRAQR